MPGIPLVSLLMLSRVAVVEVIRSQTVENPGDVSLRLATAPYSGRSSSPLCDTYCSSLLRAYLPSPRKLLSGYGTSIRFRWRCLI